MRSIGHHCAMLEEDAMHLGTEADVFAHAMDISGKKTQLRGLLDTGVVLSVIPIETWKKMRFDKDDLIDSRKRLSAANKEAGAAGSRQDTNKSPKSRGAQFVDEFLGGGESKQCDVQDSKPGKVVRN